MKIDKPILEKYYTFLYIVSLSAGSLFLINAGLGLNRSPLLLLLCTGLCVYLVQWSTVQKTRLPVFGGIFVFILLLLFLLKDNEAALQKVLLLSGVFTCCLVSGLTGLVVHQRIWQKTALVCAQLTALFIFGIRGTAMSGWEVVLVLFGILMSLCELVQRGKQTISGGKVVYLVPLLAVSLLPLLFLPVRQEPIRWSAVKNAAQALEHQFQVLITNTGYMLDGNNSTYSVPFTGFNENSSLGGDIFTSDLPQLTVKGSKTFSPLYLTGSMRNTYTQNGWEHDSLNRPYSGEEYLLAHEQLTSALSQSTLTPEEKDAILHPCSFELEYTGVKTKTLFLAPMTHQMFFNDNITFRSEEESPVMGKAQGIGFCYRIYANELNYGSEVTRQFLRGEAFMSPVKLTPRLEAREEYIHREYTRLPDELPGRVRDLAVQLTAGLTNDYDKLTAIQDYLAQYTYTTQPGSVPEGRDFTDYFLFDSQTGYCTYFATSMAVLSRCAGIPSRYAEGFITADTCKTSTTAVSLTGANAHAWTEAYIDGIGWILIDSTPAYYDASLSVWSRPDEPRAAAAATPFRPSTPEIAEAEPEQSGDTPDIPTDWRSILTAAAIGLLLLLTVALLPASTVLIRIHIRRRRYRSLSAAGRTACQLNKLLTLCRLQGFPLKDGETLTAFENRVNTDGILDTPETAFPEIIRLYQSTRFGGVTIQTDMVRQIETYVSGIEKRYLSSCTRLRKILYYL